MLPYLSNRKHLRATKTPFCLDGSQIHRLLFKSEDDDLGFHVWQFTESAYALQLPVRFRTPGLSCVRTADPSVVSSQNAQNERMGHSQHLLVFLYCVQSSVKKRKKMHCIYIYIITSCPKKVPSTWAHPRKKPARHSAKQ